MGRSIKYTDEIIEGIRMALDEYVSVTMIPIIAEFAYKNELHKQRLYEFAENNTIFSDSMKKATTKKEAQLEKLGMLDKVNVPMAIFSLKQLGWSDKKEISMPEDVHIVVKFNEVIDGD